MSDYIHHKPPMTGNLYKPQLNNYLSAQSGLVGMRKYLSKWLTPQNRQLGHRVDKKDVIHCTELNPQVVPKPNCFTHGWYHCSMPPHNSCSVHRIWYWPCWTWNKTSIPQEQALWRSQFSLIPAKNWYIDSSRLHELDTQSSNARR